MNIQMDKPRGEEEIPYKDSDGKAWINVEAYDICVQEDQPACCLNTCSFKIEDFSVLS